ncbi:hypothetical protein BH24PSE2_BH24PSE2_11980 [soil metagenome]
MDLAAGISAFNEYRYTLAVEELTPLAEAGDPDAMYYLACIRNPNFEPIIQEHLVDVDEAACWYVAAAKLGHAYATYELGKLAQYERRLQNYRRLIRKTSIIAP